MTTPVQRERVKEILDLALERPVSEREAFVSGMSAGDGVLRGEVLSLLGTLEAGGTMLEPDPPAGAPAEPLTGLRFGAYTVTERIGAGGMGVVYRAEDTRLGRTVAVKALPVHLAMDPHRRARFEQEARVLASLNHSNVGAIYGVEDTPRGPVLVLEFVGGESLAQRIARGPVPLDEALPIARQILRGLEAAHGAGVVHRDLKPANIHVVPDGAVKVLDFGIAKIEPGPLVAASPSTPGASPVVVATGPVGVLGTASYMSPEQARGKPVDRRTDIWAFGCTFYEMLTGRRAFWGETFSDTLAALLRAEPDWSCLPADLPVSVGRLLRRCLEKDPDLRLRDAGDVRVELDSADPGTAAGVPAVGTRSSRRWRAAALVATAALVGVVLLTPPWRRRPSSAPGPARVVRFTLPTPLAASFNSWGAGFFAVSPDGVNLVYAGGREDQRHLFKRSLDTLEAVELPGTTDALCPFFSPDGAWIGFMQQRQIKRIPLHGGGAEVIASEAGANGAAWAPDGSLVFTTTVGSLLLQTPGASPRVLVPADGAWCYAHPEIVPDHDAVLFTAYDPTADTFRGRIEAVRLSSGERSIVFDAACCPRFVPPATGEGGSRASPGRLLFWEAGSLLAAPFDPVRLRVTGAAVPILSLSANAERLPIARFAVSRTGGVLASLPSNVTYDVARLAWFDPAGSPPAVIAKGSAFDTPRLSPDGARIASISSTAGVGDLWVHDIQRGSSIRLTTTGDAQHPLWTPDGQRIAFSSGRSIRWIAAGAGADAEVLCTMPDQQRAHPSSFTPDGRTLLITISLGELGKDLFALDLQTRAPARPLFPEHLPRSIRIWPRLSPDGTLLAYTSEETGHSEVYLHRYPDLSEKTAISVGGGYRPTWAPDGRTLYYQWGTGIFAVDIESAGALRVSRPRTVLARAPDLRFDVGRDGRILIPHPSGDWGVLDTIDVTVGWDRLPGASAGSR